MAAGQQVESRRTGELDVQPSPRVGVDETQPMAAAAGVLREQDVAGPEAEALTVARHDSSVPDT
jgi:hypothetical protein